MALHRVTKRDLETFTLAMAPKRSYTSGSSCVTGSILLFARGSGVEKDAHPLSAFNDVEFVENDLDSILTQAVGSNILNSIETYMSLVNAQETTLRNSIELNIIRQHPAITFADETLKKRVITEHLLPYYRPTYPTAHFAYSNYHSLNFFSGSNIPSDCAIMYPNTGQYNLTGAFTFDFYVNPRRSFNDAGTIFFLSSSYCVALHTGSLCDQNGDATGFRLSLQLTQSTDVNPHDLETNDFAFFSDDNSLRRNKWHHVAIRWGNSSVAAGSGSFIIDGIERGAFNIPTASINTAISGTVLTVGNYIDGTGHEDYFNVKTAARDGIQQISAFTADPAEAHPAAKLNAEVHDLKIYRGFRSDAQIFSSSLMGPDTNAVSASPTDQTALIFYLPPFFKKISPTRAFVDTHGGVKESPFFEADGTTTTPFNARLAFGVNGLEINTENFMFDFANEQFPRLFDLTGSTINTSSELLTADNFMMDTGSFVARHYLVLPNDNGKFTPDFAWLTSGAYLSSTLAKGSIPNINDDTSFCVDDRGVRHSSFINLRTMLSGVVLFNINQQSGSLFEGIATIGPTALQGPPSTGLTIYERTRDQSSNAISWFDISNLFYGHSIKPGSLVLSDVQLTGTSELSMSLRDDGQGNLYRADCDGAHATWNTVGNVFYNEGIVFLKSPHLGHFGKDQFNMEFNGESTLHTLTIHALAGAGLVNSSSNPSFNALTSSLAHESDGSPVMITGMNFHDRNMNIVLRSTLAQPVYKRNSDRLLFKPKVDF